MNTEIREILIEHGYESATVIDGFDDAIIGVSEDSDECQVVYDFEKMIACLMKDGEMDRMGAIEFLEYDTLRALPYVDFNPPIIIRRLEDL